MKKMLTLLTVAIITANLTGCSCCRRLCPFLDRGAYCGAPAPIYAPLAAAAPAYQPYTYAAPLAATAPNACCPAPAPAAPCCSSWDPCQGVVNYGYAQQPGCSTCGPTGCATGNCQQMVSPMAYGETGCGYEPSCGSPYMDGMMMGGPMMSGGCSTCASGGAVMSGGVMSPSAVPTSVMPTPGD